MLIFNSRPKLDFSTTLQYNIEYTSIIKTIPDGRPYMV